MLLNRKAKPTRIVSWNINSVRVRLDLLKDLIEKLKPDILCLQEIKAQNVDFPQAEITTMGLPYQFVQGMKSYNGVATLSRVPLADSNTKNWCGKEDARYISANIGNVTTLHNFYVPAGGDEPNPDTNPKFAHKLDFIEEATKWSKSLPKKGKHILVGDLNIAPNPNDVWSHQQLLKVVSHTPIEVQALQFWKESYGWVDAIRTIIPENEKLYSWWSYRNRSWPGSNRGRRLDHIWVSPILKNKITNAGIYSDARGWLKPSDHAPVWIDINL